MAENSVADAGITHSGVFDLGDFYFHIYKFVTDTLGYGFNEDDYSQWVKDSGTDIEFHWTLSRKQDDYVNFRIWIECKVRFMTKVKQKVGGKTRSLNKAEIELSIKGIMITDPGKKWANHPLLKHFQKFYETVIFKSQLDDYTERLWEHVFNLEGEIKAFFDLPKFM